MGIESRAWVVLSFGLVFLEAAAVNAGGLSIWPVQVDLSNDGAVQELQISNPTDETSYVQVMAVEWHEPGQTNNAAHIDSILAVPPVFELSPNSSQLVRLASRGSLEGGVEHSYRLVITEVPRTAGLVPNTLAIAARMTLPVFVKPEGAAPSPAWHLAAEETATPELVLVNEGSAHIKINKIKLIGAGDEKASFSTEEGALVLAGEEERWPLDIELSRLKGPVTVQAETTAGPLESTISLNES